MAHSFAGKIAEKEQKEREQMTNATMKPEERQAISVLVAVADTVRELGRAPKGPIYAALMERGCGHMEFELLCSCLCGTGIIRQEGDELVWIGPKKEKV